MRASSRAYVFHCFRLSLPCLHFSKKSMRASSRAYVSHCFRLSLPCLHSTCYFIDCWASPSRGAHVSSSCPGLTASRAAQGGFFLSSLMRMTNLSEMLLLMGFRSKFLKGRSKLGDKAFGHAIGNSIAVGVLARILKNAMWALGWRS